jgi:hypothetical protein
MNGSNGSHGIPGDEGLRFLKIPILPGALSQSAGGRKTTEEDGRLSISSVGDCSFSSF